MQAFHGRPSLSAERPRNEKPRRKAGSSPPEQPGRSSDFSEDRIRFSAFPVCCIPFPDRTVSSLFRTESSMRYALRHVRTAILPEKAARTFREPSKNSGIAMTEYDSPALSSERRGHRFPFYLHPPSGFSEHRSATLSGKIASRATYDKEPPEEILLSDRRLRRPRPLSSKPPFRGSSVCILPVVPNILPTASACETGAICFMRIIYVIKL